MEVAYVFYYSQQFMTSVESLEHTALNKYSIHPSIIQTALSLGHGGWSLTQRLGSQAGKQHERMASPLQGSTNIEY